MKRIDIRYGGELYSVGGRDLQELLDEVAAAAAGAPRWIRVNDGEGMRRDAFLLITPGTPVSIIPVPAPEGLHDSRVADEDR